MTRILATGFGLLMVGLAAVGSQGAVLAAAAAAFVAVGIGTKYRPAATWAVSLTAVTIAVGPAPTVFAALAGLCAAGYLVCRYPVGTSVSLPSVVAAVGFAFVGIVATSFPLQLPWFPLAAPVGALAMYVLATRPFLS